VFVSRLGRGWDGVMLIHNSQL